MPKSLRNCTVPTDVMENIECSFVGLGDCSQSTAQAPSSPNSSMIFVGDCACANDVSNNIWAAQNKALRMGYSTILPVDDEHCGHADKCARVSIGCCWAGCCYEPAA